MSDGLNLDLERQDLTLGDQRLINEFVTQNPEPSGQSCVYGIVDQQTGELLYIGETKALMRRISDHFRTRSGSNLLHLVEQDDEIGIEGGRDGNIWQRTAVKYVEVTGAKARRRKIEQVLEEKLEPRYASG